MLRASWFAVLIASLACGGCTLLGAHARPWVVEPAGPQSGDPGLAALADRIYPGPQTSLRARMSGAVLDDVDDCPEGVHPQWAAEEALKEAVLRWREAETIDDPTRTAVARAVARAEGLAEAGREPELQVLLIDAYAALDERPDDVTGMFTGPRELLHALMRRTAASLLRSHPGHVQVPAVLHALSAAARRRGDFDLAAEVLALQVARLGDEVGTVQLWTLAEACYRALMPTCGDAATARLRAAGEDVGSLEWMASQAQLVGGPPTNDPEAQLDRADASRALGRADDAEHMYRRVATALPSDARPRLGLARLALRRGDHDQARAQLAEARTMAHRGRDDHELAIALAWRALTTSSGETEPRLAELRALADGYRRHEPARARVLAILLRAQGDGGHALASDDQPAIASLLAEFPDSRDAHRLAYLAAQVAPTAAAALTTVRKPLPPQLRELEALRVRTWFDVAVRWDRSADLPEISAALESWPEAARGDLGAAVLAARAALSGEPPPLALTDHYTRLAEAGSPAVRARALNNLAVLQLHVDPDAALGQWADASSIAADSDIVRLNTAATLVCHDPARVDLPDLLRSFLGAPQEVGLLAQAWRHELAARTRGPVKDERTALAARLREFTTANPGAALPGRWGLLAAPPRMDLGYDDDRLHGAEVGGLQLSAEVSRDYWLIAPIDVAALADTRTRRQAGRASRPSCG